MRRRCLLAVLLAAAATPRLAAAQQQARVPRVGVLSAAASADTPMFRAFEAGLRQLGYVVGETVVIEYRFSAGPLEPLSALAAELVRLPVDVIVTDGGDAVAQLAQAAARGNIPIVMATSGNPVGVGLARSYAHPAGNVTGFTLLSLELAPKRLQLLREAFPSAAKVAAIWDPPNGAPHMRLGEAAAPAFGIELLRFPVSAPDGIEAAIGDAVRAGAQGFWILPSAMFWNARARIVDLVTATRLPAIYPEREYAEAGGVLAYGPNVADNFRRAAGYVDKILKGANPGELPIAEPVMLEMIVNLRAARALGVALPDAVVARADEVIE